jgi:non-heme Fe2+,alpha-ketoglutarate-dependent halogenase
MNPDRANEIARQFEAQGYFAPIDVFAPDEIVEHRRAFETLEAREGREKSQVGLFDRHRDIEFVWRMATHPNILRCIDAIVGPNVFLLSSLFFCKYPPPRPTFARRIKAALGATSAEAKFVDWHQDLTYWGLEPAYAITAWIALDDSDVENGCMRVIPESHRQGIVEHTTSSEKGNLLNRNQAIQKDKVDESRAVDLVLRAGQASLHHGELFHASNPNRSTRRRCGLAVRYTHPGVRPIPDAKATVRQPILLRGIDEPRHFGDTSILPFSLTTRQQNLL